MGGSLFDLGIIPVKFPKFLHRRGHRMKSQSYTEVVDLFCDSLGGLFGVSCRKS